MEAVAGAAEAAAAAEGRGEGAKGEDGGGVGFVKTETVRERLRTLREGAALALYV